MQEDCWQPAVSTLAVKTAPHQLCKEVAGFKGGATIIIYIGWDADADGFLVQRVDRGWPAHGGSSLASDPVVSAHDPVTPSNAFFHDVAHV